MVLRFTMNHAQDGNGAVRVLAIFVLRQETLRVSDGDSDRRIRRVHGLPYRPRASSTRSSNPELSAAMQRRLLRLSRKTTAPSECPRQPAMYAYAAEQPSSVVLPIIPRRELGDRTCTGIRSGKRPSQERQPVPRQSVLRLSERAPDGGGAGDGLVVGGEGFDHHGAVVSDLVQSGADGVPGNGVGPGSTSIVATGVEVDQLVADEADRRGLVLLLDIHVEGVQQRADCRGIDAVDDLHRLRSGVEEAGLEAIERLDREANATLPRVVGKWSESFHQPVDVRRAFGVIHLPRLADGGIQRTGNDVRSNRR